MHFFAPAAPKNRLERHFVPPQSTYAAVWAYPRSVMRDFVKSPQWRGKGPDGTQVALPDSWSVKDEERRAAHAAEAQHSQRLPEADVAFESVAFMRTYPSFAIPNSFTSVLVYMCGPIGATTSKCRMMHSAAGSHIALRTALIFIGWNRPPRRRQARLSAEGRAGTSRSSYTRRS